MAKHDADLVIRIPQEVKDALKQEADSIYSDLSTVARIALVEYLRRKNRLPDENAPIDNAARSEIQRRAKERAK